MQVVLAMTKTVVFVFKTYVGFGLKSQAVCIGAGLEKPQALFNQGL